MGCRGPLAESEEWKMGMRAEIADPKCWWECKRGWVLSAAEGKLIIRLDKTNHSHREGYWNWAIVEDNLCRHVGEEGADPPQVSVPKHHP
jgi:hypothetical protein